MVRKLGGGGWVIGFVNFCGEVDSSGLFSLVEVLEYMMGLQLRGFWLDISASCHFTLSGDCVQRKIKVDDVRRCRLNLHIHKNRLYSSNVLIVLNSSTFNIQME